MAMLVRQAPRLDRGQIDRGEAPLAKPSGPVNTDAKMVFGDENYEGKLKYSLEHHGLVSQFSRWIVDRMFNKREMRILMVGLDASGNPIRGDIGIRLGAEYR